MKKTVIIFLALMIPFFSALLAQENADFAGKAREYTAQLLKKQSEYLRVKSRYEQMLRRLNELKSRNEGNPLSGFVNSMKMDYYLKAGNSAGYRIYVLNKQIKELSAECFTFDSLVVEDLTKKFQECLNTKCGQAQQIYDDREKWTSMAMGTGEVLIFDLDIRGMLEGLSAEAKEDLKEYLTKKQVQIDERIFILKEEKGINAAAKKYGLKTALEAEKKADEDMAKLLRMKKESGVILAGIK
jgi:hypothetical protein